MCLLGECDDRCDDCFNYGPYNCTACNTTIADEIGDSKYGKICECKWNYEYNDIINRCELRDNPCHHTCAENECSSPSEYDCIACANEYYMIETDSGDSICISECPDGYVTD